MSARKQQMIIQSRELEALQKKIRDAEERLKARESNAPAEGSNHKNGTGKREDDGRSTGEEPSYLNPKINK